MRTRAPLLVVMAMLAASCGSDVAVVATGAPRPVTSAVVRVTQVQTTCCYMEGSLGILEVLDAGGERAIPLAAAGPIEPNGSGGFVSEFEPVTLPPGRYQVSVWQYVCPGPPCSDDPAEWERVGQRLRSDLCMIDVDLSAGNDREVLATWSPGEGCEDITA